jgi:flagellar biosynthesis activator protein FlaF
LNVANLANFIINHSMKLESDRTRAQERLGVLININREIAAGLRAQAA